MTAKNQRLTLVLLALGALGGGAARLVGTARPGGVLLRALRRRRGGAAARSRGAAGRDGRARVGEAVARWRVDRLRRHGRTRDDAGDVQRNCPRSFPRRSGVVAEGHFTPARAFVATNLLAKHDEKYMPPQVAGEDARDEDASTHEASALIGFLPLMLLGIGAFAALAWLRVPRLLWSLAGAALFMGDRLCVARTPLASLRPGAGRRHHGADRSRRGDRVARKPARQIHRRHRLPCRCRCDDTRRG
ncbi:cytochrome c maturation protein CcmE domain-containing protein [Sphingomonas sp. MMS24-JH45]